MPQARIYMVWNVPQWESADADLLGLAANVLSTGKTSRLYQRLVYGNQIATSVTAALDAREIASQFYIMATVRPGAEVIEGGESHSRGACGTAQGRPHGR